MTTSSRTSKWVKIAKPMPHARLRLFCLPYAGGGASMFHTWSEALPPTIEVCALQLPGREDRLGEPPFRQFAPLLEVLIGELQPYRDLPYAFFGHSLGALIAFELVRELRRQGWPDAVHLFVSARGAPQLPNMYPPIHQLPDEAFSDVLHFLYGTSEVILSHPELMELFRPLLRADFALHESYVYAQEAPLNCAISAYGGVQDDIVPQETLAAWQNQTQAPFRLRLFPGKHLFLKSEQEALLQAIAEELTPSLSLL